MATAVFGICSDVQNVASEIEPFSLRVIVRRLKFGNFSLFLISVKPIKSYIAALLNVYLTNIDIRMKKAEYFIVSIIAQGTHINYKVYMQSLIKTFNNIRLDIEHFGTPFVICTQSHGDAEMFTLIKPLLEYGNRRDEAWLQIPSTHFQYKKSNLWVKHWKALLKSINNNLTYIRLSSGRLLSFNNMINTHWHLSFFTNADT